MLSETYFGRLKQYSQSIFSGIVRMLPPHLDPPLKSMEVIKNTKQEVIKKNIIYAYDLHKLS